MLRSFDGDKDKLGAAEKFCRSLIALPSYALRVEGMLMRSEFQGNVDSIQSKTDAIVKACQGIITSRSLKLFLKTVLRTCNFINSVTNELLSQSVIAKGRGSGLVKH